MKFPTLTKLLILALIITTTVCSPGKKHRQNKKNGNKITQTNKNRGLNRIDPDEMSRKLGIIRTNSIYSKDPNAQNVAPPKSQNNGDYNFQAPLVESTYILKSDSSSDNEDKSYKPKLVESQYMKKRKLRRL